LQSGNRTLWFITENIHKYREARRILDPYRIRLRILSSPKIEIQSRSLKEIAKFAAGEAVKIHDRMIVVEDSGLFVNALKGFPGPFSAYTHATIGIRGLLQLMRHEKHREAHFEAFLATASPADPGRVFSGRVSGIISQKPFGVGGFGFDPIFIPRGTRTTFAQGGEEFKDRYSHRARAFRKLALWFAKNKD